MNLDLCDGLGFYQDMLVLGLGHTNLTSILKINFKVSENFPHLWDKSFAVLIQHVA